MASRLLRGPTSSAQRPPPRKWVPYLATHSHCPWNGVVVGVEVRELVRVVDGVVVGVLVAVVVRVEVCVVVGVVTSHVWNPPPS